MTERLFITVAIRNNVKPAYAMLKSLFEILKKRVSLLKVLIRVLLAKIYVNPNRRVAETLMTKKAAMFVLTMPIISGFISAAPKYRTPTTVVIASMVPNKIRKKLGNISDFRANIWALSFSLKT
jgi:hypothetical protein